MIALIPSGVTTVTGFEQNFPTESKAQWSETVLVRSKWQTEVLKAVFQVANLPSNWDSYGSPALSPLALAASKFLLAMVDLDDLPVPFVAPVPGGGVQFEWIIGERELELEILPDGAVEFLKAQREQPAEEGYIKLENYRHIPTLLSWVTSG